MRLTAAQRHEVVLQAQNKSISRAARDNGLRWHTVKNWVDRFATGGLTALSDRSTRINESTRLFLISIKERNPDMGARKVKQLYFLEYNRKTIYEIWRGAGLL